VEVRKSLKACKGQLKQRYNEEKTNCAGLTGSCKGCCGENYAGACRSVFRGTDGYGTTFRTYGSHSYRPDCTATGNAQPGDPRCSVVCEKTRAVELARCGKASSPECAAQAEASYQACLVRCGVTPTTTTTTSTTTSSSTTTSTSTTISTSTTTSTTVLGYSCGALACDQYDDFCVDASCTVVPGGATCTFTQKPNTCDDGDACNGYESVDCATGCQPGTSPCAASDFCYVWQCTSTNNVAACNATALPDTCDDGNACNGYEYRDCATGCQPGTNPCVSDYCYTQECTSINNGASCNATALPNTCDDGDGCNGYEQFDCATGACSPGPPTFCPPGQHCVSEANIPRCES
jgi:hypothetical protein